MIFSQITAAPADPILGLTEAFKADPRTDKVNLGVGIYKDEAGQTPVLKSVKLQRPSCSKRKRPRAISVSKG